MESETFTKLSDRISKEEGFRQFPYLDSLGILTIGYGRNLVSRGIDQNEASYLLARDIKLCEKQLDSALPWTRKLDQERLGVLVDLDFNIGLKSLLGFRKALAAIQQGNWQEAKAQLLNSKWATQVGQRATELAGIMESGKGL